MYLFMYKVPPLDYANEDISLEFTLTTLSGTTPLMAVSFCDEKDTKKCTEGLYREIILDKKNK